MYDEKTCKSTESAWSVCGKGEYGPELWFYESHLTDDEYSPTGTSWTFASFTKDADGKWSDFNGGQYWAYDNATELDEVIGETLPFREFAYGPIPHDDFDAICFGGDTAKEREYAAAYGIKLPEQERKVKTYNATITETLSRTVMVKANSAEEAYARVAKDWNNEVHVLGAEDFEDVNFTVVLRPHDKGLSR